MPRRIQPLVVALCTIVTCLASGLDAGEAFGQQTTTGRVRGRVVDGRTGQALARVRVEVAGSDASAVTDADGQFELQTNPGAVALTVSVIGYVLAKREINIAPDRTVDLTIPLTEGTGSYTEEVRVSGERFPRTESGVPTEQTLGSAELQNLKSTLADDPFRAVQSLPGVANSDDFKSEFAVRGSDFRHVGVSLDGVPSPLLLHTVHGVTDTGSLAMINSDILDGVTLLGGSYPQRYGNRTGASVEFRTREGSRDRPHARFTASAINVSGVAEGPVGRNRRGSWLVSARKSYLDWLVRRIDPDVTGTFGFIDAHGKVAYDLSPSHTLFANIVYGRSSFDERERSQGLNSLDVGLNRTALLHGSLRSTITPAFIVTQRFYGVAGRFRNLNPLGTEITRAHDRDLSYRVEMTTALRDRLLLESGIHLQWLKLDGLERRFNGAGRSFEREYGGTGSRQSAFTHLRWQARPFVTVSPGVRIDRWTMTDETYGSPWLQVEMGLPGSLLVAGGAGLYRQAPDLEQLYGPRGSVLARSEHAWQGDLGIGQRVGAWRWQAVAFVREEWDMLRLPANEPRVAEGRFEPESLFTGYANTLRGTSHGAELFLYRRSSNSLSGWIGYAYAATRYQDSMTGEAFISDVDQRHTLNVYGSYRFSDRTNVSGRVRVGSNAPLVGYYERVGERLFLSDTRNALRLPTYSRMDLRAARTYTIAGGRLTLFVEVINVFNRRNVRAKTGDISFRRLEVFDVTEPMFPIIPSAGVTVEF